MLLHFIKAHWRTVLAVVALASNDTPIICNGFKDDEFIKMTVLARKLGKNVIPVVEKFTELEAIVRYAEHRPGNANALGAAALDHAVAGMHRVIA